jgi:hypothetical protein
MTLTEQYTRAHHAFAAVAREEKLTPFEVRVLVAISDLGPGAVRSDTLEQAIGDEGSGVRRALSNLYRTGHTIGVGSLLATFSVRHGASILKTHRFRRTS